MLAKEFILENDPKEQEKGTAESEKGKQEKPVQTVKLIWTLDGQLGLNPPGIL